MVGVIDGFRWCILGGNAAIDWRAFGISMAVTAFFLWLSIRKVPRHREELRRPDLKKARPLVANSLSLK